jgi:hypothetical protein
MRGRVHAWPIATPLESEKKSRITLAHTSNELIIDAHQVDSTTGTTLWWLLILWCTNTIAFHSLYIGRYVAHNYVAHTGATLTGDYASALSLTLVSHNTLIVCKLWSCIYELSSFRVGVHVQLHALKQFIPLSSSIPAMALKSWVVPN